MIFWILLTIAIIAVIVAFIDGFSGGYGYLEDGFFQAFITAAISSAIGFVVLFVSYVLFGTTTETTSVEHHNLRAIATGSGIHGEFFLGSGYINSTQQFSYLTEDSGAVRLANAKASESTVYEDGDKSVTITRAADVNNWVAPFTFPHDPQYTFHVPQGSVQDGYAVTAQQ